jgi:hypothetical protein
MAAFWPRLQPLGGVGGSFVAKRETLHAAPTATRLPALLNIGNWSQNGRAKPAWGPYADAIESESHARS